MQNILPHLEQERVPDPECEAEGDGAQVALEEPLDRVDPRVHAVRDQMLLNFLKLFQEHLEINTHVELLMGLIVPYHGYPETSGVLGRRE